MSKHHRLVGAALLLGALTFAVAPPAHAWTDNPTPRGHSLTYASELELRVWTPTMGGALASKLESGGWTTHVASGVSGGTDAWDAKIFGDSRHREHVHYVRNGLVRVLRLDAGTALPELTLPGGGRTFENSDVAVVRLGSEVVVAAMSSDGRLCKWTGNLTTFGGPSCTAAGVFRVGDDIVGAPFMSDGEFVPAFFTRGKDGTLKRARRVAGEWSWATLSHPAGGIEEPLAGFELQGRSFLGVKSGGRLHLAQVNATSTTPTFRALPALPEGTLGYSFAAGQWRTVQYGVVILPGVGEKTFSSVTCKLAIAVSTTDGIWRWTASRKHETGVGTLCPDVDPFSGTWERVGLPAGAAGMSVTAMEPWTEMTVPSLFGTTYLSSGSWVPIPGTLWEASWNAFEHHGKP